VRRSWALLLLVLAAAGCGGSTSYAEQADAICRERAKTVAALPTPRTLDEQASVFGRGLAAERREVARLKSLDPPAGKEREAAALVRAVQRVVAAAEQLRVAGLSSDSESAQGALYQGKQAAEEVRRHARALGLKACGES
jgi:hypothetical protein